MISFRLDIHFEHGEIFFFFFYQILAGTVHAICPPVLSILPCFKITKIIHNLLFSFVTHKKEEKNHNMVSARILLQVPRISNNVG